MYVWLGYVRRIVQMHFNFTGVPVDEKKLFQYAFPDPLWVNLQGIRLRI